MKKILIGALCTLAWSGFLAAEDNGVFVGVSYQGGQVKLDEQFVLHLMLGGVERGKQEEAFKRNPMMNGAGIKIGYKQFFGASKWFGLRYYGFLDYGYANFGSGILPNEKYHTHMLSYGVGVDTLWNFVNTENTSFGVFVGVGVGADTWIANGKDFQKEYFPKGKPAYANFQTTIDVGIRTNIYKHHGFEVGVKVPLIKDKIFRDKDDETPTTINGVIPATEITSNQTDMKRMYSVYASYIYTF